MFSRVRVTSSFSISTVSPTNQLLTSDFAFAFALSNSFALDCNNFVLKLSAIKESAITFDGCGSGVFLYSFIIFLVFWQNISHASWVLIF